MSAQGCEHCRKRRALRLLPPAEDDKELRLNIGTIIGRILTQHMPYLKLTFEDIVKWHIPHKYSSVMSSKSIVVSNCN